MGAVGEGGRAGRRRFGERHAPDARRRSKARGGYGDALRGVERRRARTTYRRVLKTKPHPSYPALAGRVLAWALMGALQRTLAVQTGRWMSLRVSSVPVKLEIVKLSSQFSSGTGSEKCRSRVAAVFPTQTITISIILKLCDIDLLLAFIVLALANVSESALLALRFRVTRTTTPARADLFETKHVRERWDRVHWQQDGKHFVRYRPFTKTETTAIHVLAPRQRQRTPRTLDTPHAFDACRPADSYARSPYLSPPNLQVHAAVTVPSARCSDRTLAAVTPGSLRAFTAAYPFKGLKLHSMNAFDTDTDFEEPSYSTWYSTYHVSSFSVGHNLVRAASRILADQGGIFDGNIISRPSHRAPISAPVSSSPKERGITIKSTAVSMYLGIDKEDVSAIKQKTDGALSLSLSSQSCGLIVPQAASS
ncbi:hypothetical protein PLICRDRAFT_173288 [Plicaturopsis crispa FD-325 SS-3]|nr:hypothetical protein PLICRDRAFT_173288 [Plicaturopsis crispa FD-325 SS-3]